MKRGHTPETRARISAARKAALADPEVHARISAACKAAWEARRPWLAAMTPEQRADYDLLRRNGCSEDEALAAMGMTR